jgi:hypothetical protein
MMASDYRNERGSLAQGSGGSVGGPSQVWTKVRRIRGVALESAKNFAADAFYCCMRKWTLYSANAKSLVFGEIERSL